MNPGTLNLIFGLVSAAIPAVGNFVVAVKNARGGVDVGMVLDSADADYAKALENGQAWLASHPKATTPATPAA